MRKKTNRWNVLCVIRILLAGVILSGGMGAAALPVAHAADVPGPDCVDGVQGSGAVCRVCMPVEGEWNGDLVVYAHGYVAFNEPIAIPEDQLLFPDGTSIPEVVTRLGFAFATTSYSANGLAVKEATEDLLDLVDLFAGEHGEPGSVYLVGVSEGGLITTRAVERYPEVFDGGLAACGPVGNFRLQVRHIADVRVLFDYFFPGVLPPSPVEIPEQVIADWPAYEQNIREALLADPDATAQLLQVSGVPVDHNDPDLAIQALIDVLWYNVFATNDAVQKLGGQPYGNRGRIYRGSEDDWALNHGVERFGADPEALAEINESYQTSGTLEVPLVTLHTLRDPIVPYGHAWLYKRKVSLNGDPTLHTNIPIQRYGHCEFSVGEVLVAFAILASKVQGSQLQNVKDVLQGTEALGEYQELAPVYGLSR